MALDPKYVIAPSLQMYFVDKDTGLPLENGYVFFYENGTNIPKDVFEINGVLPDISYTVLPNPVRLSAVGTFQDDSGNDIIPYYYPYDVDGNIQLYSIEVYDQNMVLQFTRDNWPNISLSNVSETEDVTNYVANGQFLLHNDIPASAANMYVAGQISALETNIAEGGWYYVRSSNSGVDNITFTPNPPVPSGNPPYAVRIDRTSSFNDARTDLVIRYPDVDAFSSFFAYNLYFNGKSYTTDKTVEIFIHQNFGSGSSSPEIFVSQATELIDTSYDATGFNVPLNFPSTAGKDIDPGNFVEIVIRMPLNQTFDLEFTNFAITAGNTIFTFFPPQVPFQQIGPSTAGSLPVPAYTGADLYLPVKMGSNGFIIDHSEVGTIYGKLATAADAASNELLMDGSVYVKANYSALGIPYSRLGNFLIANSPAITIGTSTIPAATIPLFGTGPNFVTILKNTDPTKFDLSFNTTGASNAVNDQTSGFTHTSADPLFTFTVPAVPAVSTYFSFTSHDNFIYNIWFSVNGAGTAPTAPTGANIPVALVTADTVATTITKILTAINQYQFLIINAKGYFWRGLAGVDPDSATRTIPGITDNAVAAIGAYLGSLEADQFKSHLHTFTTPFSDQLNSRGGGAADTVTPLAPFTGNTGSTGGAETRPVNLALNWFIRY